MGVNERERERALTAMRQAVLGQAYVLTPHAVLELRKDRLDIIDIESAILTGIIERVFEDDPRGPRYEVVGRACDLRMVVGVVARFAGPLLVITVYEKRS